LDRYLCAADFCAELIIDDSGSTERTLEIAAHYNARIFHRTWTGYRDQKNFGAQQATQNWIFCIDADEVVSEELRRSIVDSLVTDPDCDGFDVNRHAFYAGRPINHSGWYPQWRTFLYRREKAEWGGREPHTVVVFHGTRKLKLRGDLNHYTYANIKQHLTKNLHAAYDAARAMHEDGQRVSLWTLVSRSVWAFFRTYVVQRGLLDGFYGFVIAAASASYTFNKYAMLRELTTYKHSTD